MNEMLTTRVQTNDFWWLEDNHPDFDKTEMLDVKEYVLEIYSEKISGKIPFKLMRILRYLFHGEGETTFYSFNGVRKKVFHLIDKYGLSQGDFRVYTRIRSALSHPLGSP